MATYIPNAADPTQPTEDKFVESAALEFRTLKTQEVRGLRFPAADAPGNLGELPVAASRAGKFLAFDEVTGQPVPGPLLTDWTITQAQILDIETVADNIVDVVIVSDNIANINAAVAAIPALAGKVSQTGATGSAVMPTGTTAQRDAVPSPGYTRFNTTLDALEVRKNGGTWSPVGSGASGPTNNPMFYENDQVLLDDYTIVGTKNASITGPWSIAATKTLTIAIGATLVVL